MVYIWWRTYDDPPFVLFGYVCVFYDFEAEAGVEGDGFVVVVDEEGYVGEVWHGGSDF